MALKMTNYGTVPSICRRKVLFRSFRVCKIEFRKFAEFPTGIIVKEG